MGNSSSCKVVGMGSIKIRIHDGKLCTLNEVRHFPHMTKNMISLSLFDKREFSFKVEGRVICNAPVAILLFLVDFNMFGVFLYENVDLCEY